VNRLIGAAGLGLLALLMLGGFLSTGRPLGQPAVLAAFALTVLLPAAGAVLLLRAHAAERSRVTGRKAQLRQQAVESEILRLAGEHAGKLTAVEVATAFAMTPDGAKEALDALVLRGQADLEVTDAGILVYSFHDVRHLGGKHTARGILDA
jgi:hypothetical protein